MIKLSAIVVQKALVAAESASNSSLWPNKLRHMSVKRMELLVAKEVLEHLKYVDMGPCERCVMGK